MDEKKHPPLRIFWGQVTEKNVNQLEILNTTIFPVKYNAAFYKEVVHAPEGFVKLAFYNELLVGSVCCRKERYMPSHASGNDKAASPASDSSTSSKKFSLYIMTLGVLAPYRERGIGHQLITHVLDLVESSPLCKDVVDIYIHVQEGNEDALRFYSRYGFEITEKIEGYYKRIEPAASFVVRKKVER